MSGEAIGFAPGRCYLVTAKVVIMDTDAADPAAENAPPVAMAKLLLTKPPAGYAPREGWTVELVARLIESELGPMLLHTLAEELRERLGAGSLAG